MKKLITKVQKFMQAEDGPTAVEYAIMLALIVIVCIAAIQAVGTAANGAFQNVTDRNDCQRYRRHSLVDSGVAAPFSGKRFRILLIIEITGFAPLAEARVGFSHVSRVSPTQLKIQTNTQTSFPTHLHAPIENEKIKWNG